MFADDVDSSSAASYHLVVDVDLTMVHLTALDLMIDGLHEGIALDRRIDDDGEGKDDVFILLSRRGDRGDESVIENDVPVSQVNYCEELESYIKFVGSWLTADSE